MAARRNKPEKTDRKHPRIVSYARTTDGISRQGGAERDRASKDQPKLSTSGRLAVVAAACLALAAFATSLRNGFVWDDRIILERQLVAFDSMRSVLFPPQGIPQLSPDYYRPLTIASFLLDRALGGDDPFAYHLSVVLMHALSSALVTILALRSIGGGAAAFGAFAGGAVFAVHPIHTESVSWIAGRSDVLATCFALAALTFHCQCSVAWRQSFLVGLCTFAALAAKENAVALVPLLFAWDSTRPRGGEGRGLMDWVRRYAGAAAALGVYVVLRSRALGSFMGPDVAATGPVPSYRDVLSAVALYTVKLIWPVGLNAYIERVPDDLILSIVGGLIIGAMAFLAMWLWLRGETGALLGLLCFIVPLLPSLLILWRIPDAPVAERYLYFPSVGLCLLLGLLTASLWRRHKVPRPVLCAALALVVVAGFVGTVHRNRVWRTNLSLWEDTARKSRVSGMPLRSLAAEHQKQGHHAEARRYFEEALTRRNTATGLLGIYTNLGTLAMQTGGLSEAKRYYLLALEVNPNASEALFNLALVTLQESDGAAAARRAVELLEKAERLTPLDPDVHAALGQALLALGDREQAIDHLRRALELGVNPTTAESIRRVLEGP